MVKSTMTETVPSWCRGGTAAAMAQNEQTTEEHSTLEQQSPGRLDHPAWCAVWTVWPAPTHIVSWLANLLCLLGRISSSSASTWGKALCRRLTTLLLPTRPASRLTTFSRSRIAWRTCTTTGQEQSECLHRARYVSRDNDMQKWLWWHFCYRWSE